MDNKIIALDSYAVKVNSKYTFYGVLDEHYNHIFRRVKETRTFSNYNSSYNRLILPELKDRPIEELQLEDYEAIINKIESTGLKPATVQRHRYLIRTVAKHAADLGLCQDVLFGSVFVLAPEEEEEKANKKEFLVNRKSFTINEEISLFQELMVDPLQDGQLMGLALMFALGLRNNEACGIKFGAIKEMQHYSGCFCAWIIESTEGDTNIVKPGGKTKNAPRVIPIPPTLLTLIQERKAYLQHLMNTGVIILDPNSNIKSIDDFPIACHRNNYTVHCASRHLTEEGRFLLRKIKVEEEELAYIDKSLQTSEGREIMGVTEKDPTAYLFRRNLGTHLTILGLTESEIQYVMGHTIDDLYATRNDFTNEERLFAIYQKLQNRPLFNHIFSHELGLKLSDTITSGALENLHTVKVQIDNTSAHDLIAYIKFDTEEPSCPIDISFDSSKVSDANIVVLPSPNTNVKRTINITDIYQQSYAKKASRKTKNACVEP